MPQVPHAPDAGHDPDAPAPDLSRRDFVALSVGGGLALAAGTVEAALTVVETEVDGQDAGRHLRRRVHSSRRPAPSRRADLARRLRPAAVDARHRPSGSPARATRCSCRTRSTASPRRRSTRPRRTFDFRESGDMREAAAADGLGERGRRGREGRRGLRRVPRRAAAGRQGEEDRHAGLLHGRPAGGADRGGACRTRIGAGASFHGGGLVTDKPDSPHLLAPKIKARMYFGVAIERRPAPARREGQAEGGVRRGQGAGARSRSIRRGTAGACPTCRAKPASRSTTSPMPSAPGPSCSRSTRRGSPRGGGGQGAPAGCFPRRPHGLRSVTQRR